MGKVAKNVKFAIVPALVGFAAAALVAACGGVGHLNYPEDWPDEFAQQVHDDFGGFYDGVEFTNPLPPTETTLATLKDAHDYFVCCFLEEVPFGYSDIGFPVQNPWIFGHGKNRYGEVVPIYQTAHVSNPPRVGEDLVLMFLSGGYYSIQRRIAPPFLTPLDEIMWRGRDLYIDILVGHYKMGNDSPLCDIVFDQWENLYEGTRYYLWDQRGGSQWWCSKLNSPADISSWEAYDVRGISESEHADLLDYPESWPNRYVQHIHNRNEGIFEGVDFGQNWGPINPDGTDSGEVGPPRPTHDNDTTLLDLYVEFKTCFPNRCSYGNSDRGKNIKIAQVVNEQGEVIDIWSDGASVNDRAHSFFLAGGYQIPSETSDESEFIPFDEITWLAGWLYVDVLVSHYKMGSDSLLCDISIRVGGFEHWLKPVQEFEDFCGRPPAVNVER